MKPEVKAEVKRQEILKAVKTVLEDSTLSNQQELTAEELDKLSEAIISNFVEITPPVEPKRQLDPNSRKIEIEPGGREGGISKKPGNIKLDLRKALCTGIEVILTGAGVASCPWLVPLAALFILDKLDALLKAEIKERHAMVLWAIANYMDSGHWLIEDSLVLEVVNKEAVKYNRPEFTQSELVSILEKLEQMGCIKKLEENKWWLREEVEIIYR